MIRPAASVALVARCLVAAVLAAALAAPAAPALARELAIERFDADVTVAADGTIEVTERIRFQFTGAWNGIIRDIPVEYRTPQGFSFRLDLEPLAITDGDGTALKVESRRVRHYRELKIWVPGATDVTRDIVIRYRVRNAIRFFETHDELYWNATGDEWEMPIQRASARVRLPAGATGIRTNVFTGAYGSREQAAEARVQGSEVAFELRRPLGFREGMTVVVGWNKGAVRPPSAAWSALRFLLANALLLAPVLVFFAMLSVWRRRGRDPAAQPVAVQYDPPGKLSPAECGTLLDHQLDPRDVTSTLVDLGVRGYLRIDEVEKTVLLFKTRDFAISMVKPQDTWHRELKPHELQMLTGLFRGGSRPRVELSDLKNEFYVNLKYMRDFVYQALLERGYYAHRPDHAARGWLVGGFAIAFTSFHGAAFIGMPLGIPFPTWVVAQLASGLIVLGFGRVMPARSESGARTAEAVRGFEEFLSRVEADRIERVVRTPEMFERFLPYAMAFGVEERWARAFADIATTPPSWYSGTAGQPFHLARFTGSLGQFTSQATSALSSSPRSSGGSGFGGGGSSGGGSGGGGGRGF